MKRTTLLAIGLLSAVGLWAAEPDDADVGSVVRLSPVVREQPHNAISDMPCDSLAEVRAESEAEQRQLRERQQQCLQAYRQFIPATGLR
ncbi:hypothetical protein [Spongiibacter tropicus]|uniref:hypothetical protein n=1 Tax=Spongiibacter tropicus TaxID=454602 RepID=UPI0003B63646|nr:hypothetical protein [Spongiibacter tropicus]